MPTRIRVQGFVLDGTWSRPAPSPRPSATRRPPRRSCSRRPQTAQYKAPHFVYAVRRAAAELLGNEDLLDRGGLRHQHHARLQRLPGQSPRSGRGVAYDMDRLTDEELVAKYGEAALALDQAAPGPQHQQRRAGDDQLPDRRGAGLRRLGQLLRRGDAGAPAAVRRGRARPIRQSGSAFKPITYATGFERGTITPATMFMDVEGDHRRRLRGAQRRAATSAARCASATR